MTSILEDYEVYEKAKAAGSESADADVVPAEAEQVVKESGEGFEFFTPETPEGSLPSLSTNNPYAKRAEADSSYDNAVQDMKEWADEWFPVVSAEFRHGNSVYLADKAYYTGLTDFSDPDPDFDLDAKLDYEGIPEEGKHRFANVKNQKQFDTAMKYYGQDAADMRTLENEGWVSRLTASITAGVLDPLNHVPWARPFQALKLMKYGSSAVNTMVTAGIATGLNASVRMKVNNELEAYDVASEFLAGAVIGGGFHKVFGGLSKGLTKAIKYAVDTIDSSFKLNADGTLMTESYGRYGKTLYKANRYVWEMFNNAPASQMRNSGDPVIGEMAGDIFGDRHQNLKGNGVVGIATDERLDMFYREEAEIAEARTKSREAFVSEGHGTAEDFDEAVSQARANTYVNINTGELRFGRLPEEEQISMFEEPKLQENPIPERQVEFRFYDEEHIKNMELSSTYEIAAMSDNPHVLEAAKAETEFWRKIIRRAKYSGVLDEAFGERGISVKRKVLTAEDAVLTPEELLKKSITEVADSEKPNIVALGHIVRKYNADGIYENIGDLKALLYREILLENGSLAPDEIMKIINGIIPKLTGNDIKARAAAFNDLRGSISFTKEREIAIHDSLLLRSGFLKKDSLATGLGLWKQLLIESDLNIIAKKHGYSSWDSLRESYYKKNKETVGAASFNKQHAEITKEVHEYNYKLLCDVESLLKGTYGGSASPRVQSWVANVKGMTYAAYGGKIFLSMIPDLAGLVFHGGVSSKTLASFTGAIGKELVPSIAKNKNAIKLLDSMIQRNRYMDLGVTADRNAISKGVRKIVEANDKISFVTYYNSVLKAAARDLIYSNIIEECISNTPNKEALNLFGITENYKIEIANAFRKFGGKTVSGLHYLPINKLEREIADQLMCTVQTSVDQTVMTPRAGNVPRYLRSKFGSMFFMFSTYPYMLYNNIMAPILKGTAVNKHAWTAITTSVGLSMLRKEISDWSDGKKTKRGTKEYWKEVLDYSYVSTHFMNIPLQAINTFQGTFNRGKGDIVGSTSAPIKFVNDMFGIMNSLCTKKFKGKGKAIRNRLPIVNTWGLRPFTNHYFKKRSFI